MALATTTVLAYGVVEQIYDTNFYVLWEATALLAGDHPYRDFYQMGWPLLTAVSTLVQWLVGYRLIGEFALHWIFIVASMVIGFRMACRLSGSVAVPLVVTFVAIVILASMPTFQFPKLLFYVIAVRAAWWYMDRPGRARAAAVGLVTAVAFLYRHDHGVYIGVGAVLAFALTRVGDAASRAWRAAASEAAAYTIAAAIVLAPWAILVQSNEGLVDYARTRAAWGRAWATSGTPLAMLQRVAPWRMLSGDAERPLSQEASVEWLMQVSLALPLFALASVGFTAVAYRRRGLPIPLHTRQLALAAAVVVLVDHRLFRESGYFVSVLPLSVVLGSFLLARSTMRTEGPARTEDARSWPWRIARGAVAFAILAIAAVAAVGSLNWDLFEPDEVAALRDAYHQLLVSPPIDGYQPADQAYRIDRAAWQTLDDDRKFAVLVRYAHDCTATGDRLFVTGSTPYQVAYYAERPIAGGHVQWHHGWRSDPVHQQQSLALIERQSVPFAFATHDPVLADLQAYPRIREYFVRNYREIEGTNGLVLVDTRRRPNGTFGQLGFPCFR